MSLKVKIILIVIAIIIIVTSIICSFVYVSHLNSEIKDLNVLITEQHNEIQSLHCQIDSLEKDIDSMHETINITNDFISNLETIHEEENNLKQDIYQEIINDEESHDWYNTPVAPGLIDLLIKNSNDMTCID